MHIRKKDSISHAKGLILQLMEKRGLMTVDFEGKREEWIYQRGRFYSVRENRGISFKKLNKRIMHMKDFRVYIFHEGEVMLKITPGKIVVLS